jgi:hypothetical protein
MVLNHAPSDVLTLVFQQLDVTDFFRCRSKLPRLISQLPPPLLPSTPLPLLFPIPSTTLAYIRVIKPPRPNKAFAISKENALPLHWVIASFAWHARTRRFDFSPFFSRRGHAQSHTIVSCLVLSFSPLPPQTVGYAYSKSPFN